MSTHPAGFRQDNEYNDGEILDPKTGRIYGAKMTLQDGGKKLNVRGCIGFHLLGRSRFGFAKNEENLMRWPVFKSDKSG
jgi:Uncharacterized protein conserved in bacteria (DUF2147)